VEVIRDSVEDEPNGQKLARVNWNMIRPLKVVDVKKISRLRKSHGTLMVTLLLRSPPGSDIFVLQYGTGGIHKV
jgi:hypothetical protein